MDADAVTQTYRRLAPIYDATFGRVTGPGRRRAAAHVNARGGIVLEVGVGTGLALGNYGADVRVTGIDYSEEMLARARLRLADEGLSQVQELRQMDARHLDFPDDHFDAVVAMYLISVVPEPQRVLAEMARVCKPDGEIVLVNHFATERGALAWLERKLGPFADRLGWHADFDIGTVVGSGHVEELSRERIAPFGLFTFLTLRPRRPDPARSAAAG
ncbi:class I SAM-dependent methyltransferase [Jannaschia seohaensis]|uniref:Phosphatidylethanolamine/phosphatidyl-N-methylethanolamine N-methyltransferase n=1 Tax=Jannaschia seohaensis TaxID=475081 RepID=A0A2Y9A2T7_9RHOB|nr:class I SAM-dependent methyltransferase [Jannaschia seohaensis]PWJ22492.1 phosphatidylethanolamine/phosphatidyl-N-methylethanolamine N-methyltransferase [Jannaschia seohaensis]SSA38770.1 phosphatidylethanolamine/phosphatidyl-N-methylethanolamine N-methyltransferase [Jannaschia seohaensis]